MKAAIFPYDCEYEPVCKYAEMLRNIEIEKILSFQGWGMIGKTVRCSDEELLIEDCMKEIEIDSCDVLWIVESEHKVNDDYLIQISKKFVATGKDIILSKKLEKNVKDILYKICEEGGRTIYSFWGQKNEIIDDVEILYDINVPVVAVYGMGEKTNKMEVQLELWKKMKMDGYNVCWISSGYEAAFFGGEQFPEFMYELYSEKKKIIYYNHFLKWIEQKKKPDVFLIGVPGGIMPVSKKQVGYFGISAFEVFNAVIPDFTVFTLYYGDVEEKYLTEVKKLTEYKFNTEVDVFYLSNVEPDIFSLDKITPVEYITHDEFEVYEKLVGIPNEKHRIFCRETQTALYEYIIEKLGSYEEMEVL